MCKDIYRSMLLDVGKITSVTAVESFPGWLLFLGWGNGKIRDQVALRMHPEFNSCSYSGKKHDLGSASRCGEWDVCNLVKILRRNCGVWRERNQRGKKVFW